MSGSKSGARSSPTPTTSPSARTTTGKEITEKRTRETELGFVKLHDKWQLAVRDVVFRANDHGGWEKVGVEEGPNRLLDASRNRRIEVLEVYPELVKELIREAQAKVNKVQNDKKLVK